MQNQVIVAFGLVILGSVLLSLISSRSRATIHGFFWGDRQLSPAITASLILTSSFSLNGLLYQVWLGYTIGWWSLLVQAVWCSSFAFLALNIHRFKGDLGEGTMHGIIATRFGEVAGKLAAFASMLGFAILIGWEVSVGATVLQNVQGFTPSFALALPILLAILGAAYTAMGGLRVNARLNAVQNILKSIVLVVAAIILIVVLQDGAMTHSPAWNKDFLTAAADLGGYALAANLAFSLFWQMVDMSNWQNLSATRAGDRSSLKSIVGATILVFLFPGVIGSVIGVAISGYGTGLGEITDGNVLNRFVEALGTVPGLPLILFAAFAAAMLSTMDGYALAASQAATWDLFARRKVSTLLPLGSDRPPAEADTSVISMARLFVFGVAIAGAVGVGGLVSSGRVALFDLVYLVVVAQMSLVGPVLVCLRTERAGCISRSWGWAPILFALMAGYLSAYLGKTLAGYGDLYNFAPVVTIAVSVILAIAVRPKQEAA